MAAPGTDDVIDTIIEFSFSCSSLESLDFDFSSLY